MRIPQFCENLFDVMLVYTEVHKVHLRAWLTDKSAERDICMCGLSLLAIDTVRIELIFADQSDHQVSQLLILSLVQQL